VRRVDFVLFASGAHRETEDDSGREPSILQNSDKALHMEDMSTREAHGGLLAKAHRVANRTEIIVCLPV